MSTFILVHGGMHGGWCWQRLVPLLEAAGHEVMAPDLTGHGADRTPRSLVTMRRYTECIAALLRSAREPVVLVGHSMGGMVVSAAADSCPEKVRHLVYLAAIVPLNGESMADASARRETPNAVLEGGLEPSEDGVSHTITAKAARATFYNDLTTGEAEAAWRQLTPQANAPLIEPVALTPGRLDGLRRTYILCERDQALPPARQQRAIDRSPGIRVVRLDSGHSPFYSRPDELATLLLAL